LLYKNGKNAASPTALRKFLRKKRLNLLRKRRERGHPRKGEGEARIFK